jgi:hypothetical protein
MGRKHTRGSRSGLDRRDQSKSWVHVGIKEGPPTLPPGIVASISSSIPRTDPGIDQAVSPAPAQRGLSSRPGESRSEDARLDGRVTETLDTGVVTMAKCTETSAVGFRQGG